MGQQLTGTDYPIFLLKQLSDIDTSIFDGYSVRIILVDENTRALCLPKLFKANPKFKDDLILEIPAGEQFKQIDTCEKIWKSLLDNNIDRNALLINLGGGVIGDMGGFVASTYKRGIDFIQIPTTLLSQVDASVGGKLGVDSADIKNSIGLFNNPKAVFICTDFLQTLAQRELMSGYAEIIKHSLIADKGLWDKLNEIKLKEIPSIEIIKKAVKIKLDIVKADPLEKGERKKLNFGHTIGHAFESYSLKKWKNPLHHGEAVALGMLAEAKLSELKGELSKKNLSTITNKLKQTYSYIKLEDINIKKLIKLMENDKKNTSEGINFTFLNNIGKSTINNICLPKDIKLAFDYLINLYEI